MTPEQVLSRVVFDHGDEVMRLTSHGFGIKDQKRYDALIVLLSETYHAAYREGQRNGAQAFRDAVIERMGDAEGSPLP